MRKQSKHRFFAKTIMSWLFEFVSSWVVRRIYSRSNGRNFLHGMSVGKVRPWVRPQSNLYVTHTPILDDVWDIFPKYLSGQMYRFYIELRRKLLLRSNFVDNVKVPPKSSTTVRPRRGVRKLIRGSEPACTSTIYDAVPNILKNMAKSEESK